MTNKNYVAIFSSLMDQYKHDIVMTMTLSMLAFVTVGILAVAGTAVWPLLLSMLVSPAAAAIAPQLRMVLLINIGLLAFHGLTAAAMMHAGQPSTFSKLSILNFSFGLLANLAYLFSQNGAIPFVSGMDFLMMPLWFIVSFFLACVLSFLPAVLAACVSRVVRAVLSIIR